MSKRESSKKLGRPSKYSPELCQQLIDHMAKGLSYESFAALIGVHRSIMYDWEKVHEEWREAKSISFDKNLLFWEQQGIDGLFNTTEYVDGKPQSSKSINATVWIFNMKNRHNWRDKLEGEQDQVNINLTLAERIAKARARSGKK